MKKTKQKPFYASLKPLLSEESQKNFKRVKEDFKCENCGFEITGDGYTDHCPRCLWGKHVDLELPGDRASECQGLMEPIKTIYQKDKFRIIYRCQNCSHHFEVRTGENDNREILIELAKN